MELPHQLLAEVDARIRNTTATPYLRKLGAGPPSVAALDGDCAGSTHERGAILARDLPEPPRPEQVVDRAVRRPLVRRRPGCAGILARIQTHPGARVEEVRVAARPRRRLAGRQLIPKPGCVTRLVPTRVAETPAPR